MSDPTPPAPRSHLRRIAFGGWFLFALAYAVLFASFAEAGILSAIQRALINVIPAALLSLPIAHLIRAHLVDAGWVRQALGHLVLAVGFGILWYLGVQVGYGLRDGWMTTGLSGRPLSGIALSWQSLQSATLYTVIAAVAYAAHFHQRLVETQASLADLLSQAAPESLTDSTPPSQVFVKDGRDLKPVAIADILALSGAGDYTRVHTRRSDHLSTTSLSEFADKLPASAFARVHRSHIVRTDAVLSVESAGNGRLTLHLPRSLSVTTSRAGARLLRASAV